MAACREGGLVQFIMHPHIIGCCSRLWIVEALIRAAEAKGDVWFATHADIAAHAATLVLCETPSYDPAALAAGLAVMRAELAADGLGLTPADPGLDAAGAVRAVCGRGGALGVPTRDRLGPCGGGLHAHDEHLDLASLGPRVAVMADLLARAGGLKF